ncbi:MAG: YhbY family RNA-binding protein [Christensenellales bacterium]|jgi:RNA-binding protein
MLTSKQRASLRAMANTLDAVIFVGKAGVTDNVVMQADDALSAHELIKGTVQQSAPINAKEALQQIAQRTGAQEVASSGRKFVLYRPKPKNPVIQI